DRIISIDLVIVGRGGRQPDHGIARDSGGGGGDAREIGAVGRLVDIEAVLIGGVVRPGQVDLTGGRCRGGQIGRRRGGGRGTRGSNHCGAGCVRRRRIAVGVIAADLEIVGRSGRAVPPRV